MWLNSQRAKGKPHRYLKVSKPVDEKAGQVNINPQVILSQESEKDVINIEDITYVDLENDGEVKNPLKKKTNRQN